MDILEDDYAIGLDLGTTFSCIGVYKNGEVEIIPNKKDEKTTPSIVIIDNNADIKVGEDTTDFLVKNYDSCIYEIKRLIGRKFSDEEVTKEKEKLPFKIINARTINEKDDDSPMIEIMNNGIPIRYNPVEISSFIIKKMVQSAEKYINSKITKLVITVPAYFNDSQRKLTKQAAELVGLKVLRVINEPTAAALAYGFDKNQEINEKILVFDLGGGTFDVSILSVKKDENNPDYKVFQVLGTSGDTQLGGEDFDNKLVEYFLNKMNNRDEIKRDKKCIKRLKISCENIKKSLSFSDETTLKIEKFYNNEDIQIPIRREEFEDICNDLFKKLEDPLEDALINAKLTKNEIKEIILVGGSTRIPKVKQILKNLFPNSKINDKINPDEAVAFGATIEAEKILHNKNGSISQFLLRDIIPLSLGTNVLNKSSDPKIQSEGSVMDVILKRGTPLNNKISKSYSTVFDNQTEMTIDIYEGENTFVKYNHLLKKSKISGLKKRPKGETNVNVTFDIDINGILIVSAEEQSENNDGISMNPVIIKNDEMSLTPEKMEQLKEKNQKNLEKIKDNDLTSITDYTNLREILRNYKNAYLKCENEYKLKTKKHDKTNGEDEDGEEEEEDERIIYINNFNDTLEEFIDSLDIDKNPDNETIIEKYYLYIKELFLAYIEALKLKIDKEYKKHINKKMKEYINKFINKNSDYLSSLLEVLCNGLVKDKKINKIIKRIFYGIVIFVMEKLNEIGQKYIESGQKYCKYNSLVNYEQANTYYEKYLSKVEEQLLQKNDLDNLKKQKNTCIEKIRDITSGAIVLCYESFKGGYIIGEEIKSQGRGITNNLRIFAIGGIVKELDIKDVIKRIELYKIVLNNYEKILLEIQNSEEYKNNTKKEAICLANIIKLNQLLGDFNKNTRIKTLLRYANRCKYIIDNNKEIEKCKNEQWFKEFDNLYRTLKDKEPKYEEYHKIFQEISIKNPNIFNEIEQEFNKKKSYYDFIKFILKKHPYTGYEEDKDKPIFGKYSLELVNFLLDKYHPDNYSYLGDNENKLKYCIIHQITKKLNSLYSTPQ